LNSMEARFDEEVIPEKIIAQPTEIAGTKMIKFSFGGLSEEELVNKIMMILYNLASLKDHLKNALKSAGKDPRIVEDAINASRHLQVLVDIVNQDKHGTPLRSARSGLDPRLTRCHQSIHCESGIQPGSFAGVSIDPEKGEFSIVGGTHFTISAFVVDNNDMFIFTLDELVETAYLEFDKIHDDNLS
jgi:hypothetical protein